MRTEPTDEDDVISVTTAIWPRWRSSGLATVVATSCGLAPGRVACTEMVGKSTCGSGDTGSLKNATMPAAANPKVSSVVAIGRRMNGVDGSIVQLFMALERFAGLGGFARSPAQAQRDAVEPLIDHRRREQRQQLAEQQAADDRDAERMTQFGARASAEHQRQGAENGGHRRHQNGAEAQQAG